jgi:hypothetical protein
MSTPSRRQFLASSIALAAGGGSLAPRVLSAPREDGNQSYLLSTNTDPQDHHDPHLHLLIDDAEVARQQHVKRIMNRLRKHPKPVLVADRPWEGERAQAWGSVIQEPDGLWRMWYFAFNTQRRFDRLDVGGYAYAESRDGVHWTKPDLDVVEFRGSKRNNLFYSCHPEGKNLVDEELARRGLGLPALDETGKQIGVINNLDGLSVVRDDDDPDPKRRYKLIANMQDHRMWAPYYPKRYPNVDARQVALSKAVFGQYIDTSPDGIHWTRRPRRLFPARGGDYMMVTRDHRNRRWWLNERAHDQGGRNASLRTSSDWKKWSQLEVVFGKGSDPEFNKTFQWHGGITPFNYGNLNIGLAERWPLAGLGGTCELVCQRPGGKWQRVFPNRPFLDVGAEESFDRVLAYPSHNPPGRSGEKLMIHYTGAGTKTHPERGLPMSMGLATIGLDRFAGLGQWRNLPPGQVVTKPLKLTRKHLAVNVEYLEFTPLRVAVLGADGSPLPGYSLEDSTIPVDSKRLYSMARWKTKPDLGELLGREVSLHFEIRGAVLYSYRFYPRLA